MAIKITEATLGPQEKLVHVTGEVDRESVSDLDETIQTLIKSNLRIILLDMTEVTYVSSAGISALLDLNAQLECQGGRLVVLGKPTGILAALDLVGFGEVALVAESMDEAMKTVEALRASARAKPSAE
jgi:anti-anti-sigma factor